MTSTKPSSLWVASSSVVTSCKNVILLDALKHWFHTWGQVTPKVLNDCSTKTNNRGQFTFEHVMPGRGFISRVLTTQIGNGVTRLAHTIIKEVDFKAGETTEVELSRDGRRVTGKLALPANATLGSDWRLATLNLISRPDDAPQAPNPPFPPNIDPQKDQDAALKWWNQWRLSDAGKAFDNNVKKYAEAVKGFRPLNYSGNCEPDGSFTFDDIPAGDYELQVQAFAKKAGSEGFQGEHIGNVEHLFVVPEPWVSAANEAVNLGEVMLQPLRSSKPNANP